ncbi:MAG: hypothetical protein Q9217_001320 [Psora testacea]
MQCAICERLPSGRLPFNCTFCAREVIYQPRIDLVLSLLENESIEKEVERSIGSTQASHQSVEKEEAQEATPAWTVQRAAVDQKISDKKTESILGHVKALREEIQHMKLDIAKRKAAFARRRKELTSARHELSRIQSIAAEPVEKNIKRTMQTWESLQQQTGEQRLLHCTQAARLYSLQQHKRRSGEGGKEIYSIGFIPITDLRELNSMYTSKVDPPMWTLINLDAPPSYVTTSLTHVANLVHLISHHLSLKLPAEISLPHNAYPLATILSPHVSYTAKYLPFPGSTQVDSSPTSPTASRHVQPRTTPRPRPLYLKKKLSCLAKDDPLTYAYVVEGITLLAWDIAWLCKTQGLGVGDGSWEEICAVGKNLWQLLLAPSARPIISKRAPSQSTAQKSPRSRTSTAMKEQQASKEVKERPPMGYFSHGTTYGFLGAAQGNEYMRDWRLQNPVKVIDKVKAMLLAERTGAEWEMLEGNEWEAEEAEGPAGMAKQETQAKRMEETSILVKAVTDDGMVIENVRREREREGMKGKGTAGWMKVKSR